MKSIKTFVAVIALATEQISHIAAVPCSSEQGQVSFCSPVLTRLPVQTACIFNLTEDSHILRDISYWLNNNYNVPSG